MNIEQTKQEIGQLVERFQALSPSQLRQLNEENTKNVFIQPLFEALGWNFHDVSEVTAELSAGRGRVDLAFRVNGVSQFYLEAKPLRYDLASNADWAKQAVGYAYSKGIPWVILTNFKDLWGFTGDGARRFITLNASDYTASLNRLWLLSKESVASGFLEKELAKEGTIPPSIPVEQRLYDQLRNWREQLFNEINQYNRSLSFEAVDETIQKLFNRLIFIRTAEDRGIEEKLLLSALRQYNDRTLKRPLLQELRSIFKYYDKYYDSDLFTLHILDGAYEQVHVEDPTLADIILGLYDVPGGIASYDFSAIDADILGAVYEQYLGHVTQIVRRRAEELQSRLEGGATKSQAYEEVVNVISRPLERKEHGVYYTPKWVTDHIVKATVGRFIEEHAKSPETVHGLTVLDMACGSGSFLIRAYDELLRWHSTAFDRTEDDLDPSERTLILRNNIFGVDLDLQAVEVARLNLMLRALGQRDTLPSLADNLRVGNSLVAGDSESLEPYFGNQWEAKRPFTWEHQFSQIMQEGGFDIIIGNPPYVRIQAQDRPDVQYYKKHYHSAYGSFDLSVLFIERALQLLKPGGRLGFITNGKFLKAAYGKKIQHLIRSRGTIEQILDLTAIKVFSDATTYPVIVVLQRGGNEQDFIYNAVTEQPEAGLEIPKLRDTNSISATQSTITEGIWPPPTPDRRNLIVKLDDMSNSLGYISTNIFTGLQTSADDIYHLQLKELDKEGRARVFSKALGQDIELESDLLKPLLSGRHIQRYYANHDDVVLLFPYCVTDRKAELIPSNAFSSKYPLCWEHLSTNREKLEGRENGKMRHEYWYAYGRTQNLAIQEFRKLAIPRLVQNLKAAYDADGKFYLDNVDVGGVLLRDASEDNYLYVLTLLNSNLIDWYFQQISAPFRGNYRSANRQFIEPLPIRRFDSSNSTDKEIYRAIIDKGEEMISLQERLGTVRYVLTSELTDIQREVERVDSDIDTLVYDLYGLTKGDERLVEGD